MRLISEQRAMSAAVTDNDILTLPRRFYGLVRRLRVRNDSAAARTLTFNDRFTPDPSNGVPTPSVQTIGRYGVVVSAGATWELDGSEIPIAKILNNFRIGLDTASSAVVVAFQIEVV